MADTPVPENWIGLHVVDGHRIAAQDTGPGAQ